jgi:hypothetical protein
MDTHAVHPVDNPFTAADIQHLHDEDFAAAKAVVSLMVGIFITGVVLYSIVAWTVAS